MSISEQLLGKVETKERVTAALGVDNESRVCADRDCSTAGLDTSLGRGRSECSAAEGRAVKRVHCCQGRDGCDGRVAGKIRNKMRLGCRLSNNPSRSSAYKVNTLAIQQDQVYWKYKNIILWFI